jgi:hypothetical protein
MAQGSSFICDIRVIRGSTHGSWLSRKALQFLTTNFTNRHECLEEDAMTGGWFEGLALATLPIHPPSPFDIPTLKITPPSTDVLSSISHP